jgi:hypothetical protein
MISRTELEWSQVVGQCTGGPIDDTGTRSMYYCDDTRLKVFRPVDLCGLKSSRKA